MTVIARGARVDREVLSATMSTHDYAAAAGVNRMYLYEIRVRGRACSLSVAERIAAVAGRPVAYLFKLEDEKRLQQAGLLTR